MKLLVDQSAPKSFFLKKYKHPYADNQKVIAVLNSKPEILKYYGIDPDQLKLELKQSEEIMKDLELKFDTVKK